MTSENGSVPGSRESLDTSHLNPVPSRIPREDLWAWATDDPHLPIDFSVASHNPMRGLKCWKWNDPSIPALTQTRVLQEHEIDRWLAEPVPEVNGVRPDTGFRILHIRETTLAPLPFSLRTYEGMKREFKLPAVEEHRATLRQGANGLFEEADGSFVLVSRRTQIMGLTSTVLRYDPATNYTEGYLLLDCPVDYDYPFSIIAGRTNITDQFLSCPHPLLVPVLFKEIEIENVMDDLGANNSKLRGIEVQTGFAHGNDDVIGPGKGRDVSGLSSEELVRMLSLLHREYWVNLVTLETCRATVKFLNEKLKWFSENLPKEKADTLRGASVRLGARIAYLESSMEHAAIWGNFHTRLQAQQGALTNLINQADARVNISVAKTSAELAAASKQDSSAMKIVAFLTTLFLPGTFLATFFAMPLFDWEKPSIKETPIKHYWLYWAVTGPLTLLTMTIVVLWAVWRARMTSRLIKKAGDLKRGSKAEIVAENKGGGNGSEEQGATSEEGDGAEHFDSSRSGSRERVGSWTSTRNSFQEREMALGPRRGGGPAEAGKMIETENQLVRRLFKKRKGARGKGDIEKGRESLQGEGADGVQSS